MCIFSCVSGYSWCMSYLPRITILKALTLPLQLPMAPYGLSAKLCELGRKSGSGTRTTIRMQCSQLSSN